MRGRRWRVSVVVFTVCALGAALFVAVVPASVAGSDGPSLSRLVSFVRSGGNAVFPASESGSAAGRGHDASTASTRAGRGVVGKPGRGCGGVVGV